MSQIMETLTTIASAPHWQLLPADEPSPERAMVAAEGRCRK
ncbi:hypothetical protein [Streptomyces xantholiticus]|uniref:Uncharacterized protein n=1 Tax=Streptomyces xantholiticus TaxID=68285 RepID=A0ABV1UVR8_9ACTN